MRTLLLVPLLLLAAPILAQEDGDVDIVVRAKVDEAWVAERVEELLSDDPARQQAAMAALKEADLDAALAVVDRMLQAETPTHKSTIRCLTKANEVLEQLLEPTRKGYVATLTTPDEGVLVLDPWSGSCEVIRGSADGYDYTLESTGEGRYTLRAKRAGEDGRTLEEFVRDGTLQELQEQYPFLKKTVFLRAFTGSFRPRRVEAVTEVKGIPSKVAIATIEATSVQGLRVRTPPEELRFHLELPEGAGLIVEQVDPGSRAEELGLRRFDILLRLDGELIDSPRQLERLGDRRGELEIIRRAAPQKIDLSK